MFWVEFRPFETHTHKTHLRLPFLHAIVFENEKTGFILIMMKVLLDKGDMQCGVSFL